MKIHALASGRKSNMIESLAASETEWMHSCVCRCVQSVTLASLLGVWGLVGWWFSCSGLVMVNVTGDEKFLFICSLIIKIIFLFYFFHLQRLFFCVKVPLLASWCVTKQHLIKALNQFYFDMWIRDSRLWQGKAVFEDICIASVYWLTWKRTCSLFNNVICINSEKSQSSMLQKIWALKLHKRTVMSVSS